MRRFTSRLLPCLVCACALLWVIALSACGRHGDQSGTVTSELAPREGISAEPLAELDGDGAYEQASKEPLVAESPITPLSSDSFPREKRDYTIMVYMVGSDLETKAGFASLDIQEMMLSNFDASRTNVLVYTGGSQRWHANIPNDRNCVIEIANGGGRVVAATDRSLNMGSTDTLAAYVSWATENYPADHTALIMWDHGGGPAAGYGFDQLYRFDSLTLDEMQQAMTKAGYGPSHRLDWVGFDACLMDSMETLQAWDSFAQYFVGSQDVEDGFGWDYSFLKTLDTTNEVEAIVTSVVDSFSAFYINNPARLSQPNATLSAIDLSATSQLESALDTLSDAVLEDFQTGNFSVIARAREQCRGFGTASGLMQGSSVPLVDFVDLADRVADDHPSEAKVVREAVDTAVIANATNISGANGVSLYFPVDRTAAPLNPATAGFGKMLEEYSAQGQSASQIDWVLPEVVTSDNIITVGLDLGQFRSLATASYTVLYDFEGRGYLPVLSNVRIQPTKDGKLEVPADPLLLVTNDGTNTMVAVEQTDSDPNRQVFRCSGARLLPGTEFIDALNGSVDAALSLALDGETGEVSVASAAASSTVESLSDGRLALDLTHYKTLMLSYGGWQYPERDDNGAMLPYTQWDELGGNLSWSEVPIEGDLSFTTKPISELDGTFMLQIVVSDVNGTKHASELMPLTSLNQEKATVATDEGKLTFALYDDHATVTEYRGEDEALEIPAEVEGMPVTEVADDALSGNWHLRSITLPDTVTSIGSDALVCYNLEQVNLGTGLKRIGNNSLCYCSNLTSLELPEGLQSIGRGALRGLGVTTLTLPASLEELGEGALVRCKQLENYAVAEGCSAVQERDGVLFSSDGTKLVAFPASRTGSYSAPEGTTTIGYGAFAATALSEVTLPEGLTTIDNCAFYSSAFLEATSIATLNLPASLESVGDYAFGSTYNGSEFKNAPYIEELHLGAALTYLGNNAFSGLRIGRFVVDEANPNYSSPGGFIANKMGDTLLEVPSGMGQVIVVPEGVTTLGKDLFELCEPGTDFVLPGTVSRISVLAFPYHYDGPVSSDKTRVYDIRLHCPEGSPAAEFAERHGVSWDTVTDVNELTAHEASVQQGDVTLNFLVYPSHATLHAIDATYAQSGTELVIPSEVEGSPVIAIDGLQQSKGLPTTWQFVELPSGLESLDAEAIPQLRSREGFVLSEDNTTYSVKDGVLFSADGRTLVAFSLRDPDAFDTTTLFSYSVPQGTRTIGNGAFTSSQLEQVIMPSSLRTIEKNAFARNSALVDIQLNEGLDRIDSRAFNCPATSITLPSTLSYLGDSALDLDGYDGMVLPEDLKHLGAFVLCDYGDPLPIGSDTLVIGRKLTTLGQDSLASADVTRFEVHERNKRFASNEGLLTNKNGRRLLRCPAGLTGELHIPSGIHHLEPGCLEKATGLTDIYFPSSVVGVDAYYTFGSDSAASKVTFHCARDSEAARYAQAHGIAWTEEGI